VSSATVAELQADFGTYLKETESGPVVVTRRGKPVAVLLAVEEGDELERLLLAHSPRLRAILSAAKRRLDRGEGIPHEQFWAEVDAEAKERKKRRARTNSRHG
jgi:prevent-host-death family protein